MNNRKLWVLSELVVLGEEERNNEGKNREKEKTFLIVFDVFDLENIYIGELFN